MTSATTPTTSAATAPTTSAAPPPGDYSTAILVNGKVVQPSREIDATRALPDAIASGRVADVSTPTFAPSQVDSHVRAVAISESGEIVAAESPPMDAETGAIGQVSVGVLDTSGSFHPFPPMSAPGVDPTVNRQAESFDVSGRTVAWAETSSTNLEFDNWSIFAANLDTNEVRSLGSSEDVLPHDDLPIIGPYLNVTAGTDRVFWGTPTPRGSVGPDGHYSDFRLDIVGRNVDGSGSLETVAQGAILPSAMGACVAYVRVHGSAPAVDEGHFVIARSCPGRPEEVLASGFLGTSGRLAGFAADDHYVAWSTWLADDNQQVARSDVVVLDLIADTSTSVNLGSRVVANLSVDASLLHWAADGTDSVVDLEDGSAWALPFAAGYYTLHQTGNRIGWFTAASDGSSVDLSFGRWVHG